MNLVLELQSILEKAKHANCCPAHGCGKGCPVIMKDATCSCKPVKEDRQNGKTSESEFEDLLVEMGDECDKVSSTRTYKDAGMLTNNAGVVFHLDDGSEFRVTVHKAN